MLRLLQFLWLLPMTILVWLVYVLPLWLMGQIRFDRIMDRSIVVFKLNEAKNSWYTKLWSGWAGWSGPCAIVYRPYPKEVEYMILAHEYRHCWQQFWFGPLHYPLYGLIFVCYWAFTDKDPYMDNPFEIDARKYEKSAAKDWWK
jgi:hypothetical protein